MIALVLLSLCVLLFSASQDYGRLRNNDLLHSCIGFLPKGIRFFDPVSECDGIFRVTFVMASNLARHEYRPEQGL